MERSENSTSNITQDNSKKSNEKPVAVLSPNEESKEVLGTSIVHVRNIKGNAIPVKILIDTGAQKNYITEGMVQKLRISREECRTNVTGIGKSKPSKLSTTFHLQSNQALNRTLKSTLKL